MTNIGVHATHCCKKHGCKYGDQNCPVELGIVKEVYPFQCEICYEDNTKKNNLIDILRWIPVTEKIPPMHMKVDFMAKDGFDGYGFRPWHINMDDNGNWNITHWRKRPEIEDIQE